LIKLEDLAEINNPDSPKNKMTTFTGPNKSTISTIKVYENGEEPQMTPVSYLNTTQPLGEI
jgi:hypothetical protein